jgi:phosphatidylserine/phosphatidylglycerophosphate/cardiolipin synthase-like enzyme
MSVALWEGRTVERSTIGPWIERPNVTYKKVELGKQGGNSTEGEPDLSVFFLAEGEQAARAVMERLTAFIGVARKTLDFAFYDMRLDDDLRRRFVAGLQERTGNGVAVRICYDGDKLLEPNLAAGQDPASPGTGSFVQSLGFPWRRIGGMKLMHNKFIVRDRQSVWTGSTNLTTDAFSSMENNIVEINSPELAGFYARDFDELWEKENFENTGEFNTSPVSLTFAAEPAVVRVMFSPGHGLEIDTEIARLVRSAQRRVRICSLLINSGTLISALQEVLLQRRAAVSGIYDRTQMADVYRQWQGVPQNHWKVPALQQVIAQTGLVGKNSVPYTPNGRHNFMHNKILVVDDVVVTGSYNFSRSAQFNAENILMIESAPLAERYSVYIDRLMQKYQS